MDKPLSQDQVEAITRIGAGLVNIDKTRQIINIYMKEHGLTSRRLVFPELGLLAHELEGLLFDSGAPIYQDQVAA